MSLTDLLDLAGSLLLILAASVWVFTVLGMAAALAICGVCLLVLSFVVGKLARTGQEGDAK